MGQSIKKRHPASGAYATALLEVGQETGESEAFAAQLAAFAASLEANPMFRVFFESPKISRPDKKAALERALSGLVAKPVLNLLQILIDRGRQECYGEIAETFDELFDELRGRTYVRIVSAMPISEPAKQRLVTLLHDRLSREIIAVDSADPALLGGMTVRIGDTVIDGSLRTKLNNVRGAITAPRLGRKLFE